MVTATTSITGICWRFTCLDCCVHRFTTVSVILRHDATRLLSLLIAIRVVESVVELIDMRKILPSTCLLLLSSFIPSIFSLHQLLQSRALRLLCILLHTSFLLILTFLLISLLLIHWIRKHAIGISFQLTGIRRIASR